MSQPETPEAPPADIGQVILDLLGSEEVLGALKRALPIGARNGAAYQEVVEIWADIVEALLGVILQGIGPAGPRVIEAVARYAAQLRETSVEESPPGRAPLEADPN